MIITPDEYYGRGFAAESREVLETCIDRAEYVLNAITEGRIEAALAAGGKAQDYVKEAACRQVEKLVSEYEQGFGNAEKVSIGDFSYSASVTEGGAYDMSTPTVQLLRRAGCLYSGTEVK